MSWKKELLKKSRLYVIIDKKTLKNKISVFNIAKKIKNLGVDIIQYRNKEPVRKIILEDARLLNKLLSNSKTAFIINDYVDIAKIVDTDGVHLGQGDISIQTARRILGENKIIGVSCHNLKQAMDAQNKGADYIGIGPIFSTPTKPGYKAVGLSLIKKIRKKIRIPFFVIGGINRDNIAEILARGAMRAVVCRAVCRAKNTKLAVNNLKTALSL